jgi:hypothetical protein
MPSTLYVIVKLYGPLVVSVVFLVASFFVPGSEAMTMIELQPMELFAVDLPIPTPVLVRGMLLVASIGALSCFAIYDYAAFFPRYLRMEVFFDDDGIRRSIATLKLNAVQNNWLVGEYSKQRSHYFDAVDTKIESLGYARTFSLADRHTIHSNGHTWFVVEPVVGWQRYRVVEAKGELQHVLEVPGSPAAQLLTFFEKVPTGEDYFTVSWTHPFRILLKPRFKQMLAIDRESTRSTFQFIIVGLTLAQIFPWPGFSNTVYCADFEGVGLVPIAYAVYH